MENIDTLSFFDFDDTTVYTIDPSLGKKIWKEKLNTNIEIDDESKWWDSPKSLDIRVLEFKPIKQTVDKIKEDNLKANCITILLTNRKIHLSDLVKKILNNIGINFDIYKFKNNDEKVSRILDVLRKFPNVKNINIYEDRYDECLKFNMFKEKYKNKYNINIIQFKPKKNMDIKEIIKEEVGKNLSKTVSMKKIKELALDITKKLTKHIKK
ncbi:MAG: hypothetical protein ACOC33_03690 [bacterium]